MLEVKYFKDYRHNYLIVKDNGSLSENVFQWKMITENRIKGLLPTSEKHINGELLLYYEITSKQSLQSYFDGKSIKMKHLRKFFIQLKVVNDALQKYLLDGTCLVFSPQYIFLNVETEEIFFLYYPDPQAGNLTELMDFLMTKVDEDDVEAVETVYRIADLIQREQFVLDEVLQWFEDEHKEKEQEPIEKNFVFSQDGYETSYEVEKPYMEKDDGSMAENDRRTIWILPAVGLSAIVAGILVYIMCFYQLSYKETIYLIAGWGVVAAVLLGVAIWYLKPYFYSKKKRKPYKVQESVKDFVQTHETDRRELEEEIGNTVFIPWAENCENKLYGMDRKNKCHIDLQNLPLTVGKLAGVVDMVINEKSISRMHARFTRSGNKIYITDLNSTNGTFKNGMRLEPNASQIIEPGDEIRMGKLKFIYR